MNFRFQKNEKLVADSENGDLPKMEVELVQKQQDNKWQFGNWGVLGISPKGSFITYLRNLYSTPDTFSLAMKYTLTETDVDNDNMRFLLQMYLNPEKEKHYTDKDIIGTYPIDAEDDYYYLKGGIAMGDTQFELKDQKMCMSTLGNELFGVINSLVWCDKVLQKLYISKSV